MIAASAHQNPKNKSQWILEDGYIHNYNGMGRQFFEAPFQTMNINVESQINTLFGEQKDITSMSGNELMQKFEALKQTGSDAGQLNKTEIEYWHHFALPGACFVMALCAAPLALRFARHGSFAGLVAAFGLAFLWQGFDGWFCALGLGGFWPPMFAASATNVLFLIVGIVLLVREQ